MIINFYYIITISIATKKFKVVNILFNKSNFDENIINVILHYYWKILENKRKILLEWIPINKIDWCWLSLNPNAIHLLEQNKDKIDWCNLSKNPSIFKDEPIPKIL
jgi:hypothetical protein